MPRSDRSPEAPVSLQSRQQPFSWQCGPPGLAAWPCGRVDDRLAREVPASGASFALLRSLRLLPGEYSRHGYVVARRRPKGSTSSTVCRLTNPDRSSVQRIANACKSTWTKQTARGKTFAMCSSATAPIATGRTADGTSTGNVVRTKAAVVRNLMIAVAERGVRRGASRRRTCTA
eukprot:6149897-Prymnesium_polylepis.1